jgi:hypothetical protein
MQDQQMIFNPFASDNHSFLAVAQNDFNITPESTNCGITQRPSNSKEAILAEQNQLNDLDLSLWGVNPADLFRVLQQNMMDPTALAAISAALDGGDSSSGGMGGSESDTSFQSLCEDGASESVDGQAGSFLSLNCLDNLDSFENHLASGATVGTDMQMADTGQLWGSVLTEAPDLIIGSGIK